MRRRPPIPLCAWLVWIAGCAAAPPAPVPADPFVALFEPMGEPRLGDWLYVHDEPGQTVEAYTRSAPNRRTEARGRIYVVPLGSVAQSEPELAAAMADFLEAFFDAPVVLEPSRDVPAAAHDRRRQQHDAGVILRALAETLPADAAARIGVLEFDLYYEDLNFVFGLGAFDERRSSVFSIARYRFRYINQPEEVTLLRRACKVAAHEIAHVFGLPHCRRWRCVLNGSNSIVEADGRPMFLCPDCLEKLRWNLGFDPARRYEALWAFYAKHPEFRADAERARALETAWGLRRGG